MTLRWSVQKLGRWHFLLGFVRLTLPVPHIVNFRPELREYEISRGASRLISYSRNSGLKLTICGTGKDNLTKPSKKCQRPNFWTDHLNVIVLLEHLAPSQLQIGLAAQNDSYGTRCEESQAAKSSKITRQERAQKKAIQLPLT